MATNIAYSGAQSFAMDAPQLAQGYITYPSTGITAADSTVIATGFKPRLVIWENLTDRIRGEWYEGMAANSCIKTIADGTRTLEVTGGNGGITVSDVGFSVLQNDTLALLKASKVIAWRAEG